MISLVNSLSVKYDKCTDQYVNGVYRCIDSKVISMYLSCLHVHTCTVPFTFRYDMQTLLNQRLHSFTVINNLLMIQLSTDIKTGKLTGNYMQCLCMYMYVHIIQLLVFCYQALAANGADLNEKDNRGKLLKQWK